MKLYNLGIGEHFTVANNPGLGECIVSSNSYATRPSSEINDEIRYGDDPKIEVWSMRLNEIRMLKSSTEILLI